MSYCKNSWKNKREGENKLQSELLKLNTDYANNLTDYSASLRLLESKQTQIEEFDTLKTEGSIIRSRAEWHEMGEKSNKYFMNLEKRIHDKKTYA
jgi:hypothetical protein